MAARERTLTGSQGSRCLGVISGFVFGLARRSAGVTQIRLAEALGVDTTTVQGWESGRRPLTALQMGDLVRARMTLIRFGAPGSLTRHLNDALEADVLLATAIDSGADWDLAHLHPLAHSVHRRSMIAMVTWPITQKLPTQLDQLDAKAPRRGPAAAHPELFPDEQQRFFDHLQAVAERATGPEYAVLRRQAIYLLGFDRRATTASWLRDEWQRASRGAPNTDLAKLVAARSAAVARATTGEPDSLHRLVSYLDDDQAATINLNHWAHWIGELGGDQSDDAFMVDTDPRTWGGLVLARHLVERIQPGSLHLPLNVHSLHALTLLRPSLLSDSPDVRTLLADAIDQVHDYDSVERRVRDELAGLAYAVRVANR